MNFLNKLIMTILTYAMMMNTSFAGSIVLDNLTSNDFTGIAEEFSANFVHTAVSSASPLGSILGFEVGLIGSVTKAPELQALSKKADPSNSGLSSIPYAGLFGSISVPYGLTFELSYLPELTVSSLAIDSYGAGVKWTFDKFIFDIPFVDLALRAHVSKSNLEFSQTLSGVNSTMKMENKSYGVGLVASVNVLIFEPYFSLGYVKADTSLSSSVSSNLFSFQTAGTSSKDLSSMQIVTGAQVNLFFMRVAGEVMRVFDTTRYSAKLTFGF